ncbi:15220_t:CDS:2, partial [Entrophospora sp. SA101]
VLYKILTPLAQNKIKKQLEATITEKLKEAVQLLQDSIQRLQVQVSKLRQKSNINSNISNLTSNINTNIKDVPPRKVSPHDTTPQYQPLEE